VHFCGGVCGLAGTTILGPRHGRFENPEEFEYHNVPLATGLELFAKPLLFSGFWAFFVLFLCLGVPERAE
jgi:ammonia channel protein AmtB